MNSSKQHNSNSCTQLATLDLLIQEHGDVFFIKITKFEIIHFTIIGKINSLAIGTCL